LGGFSTGMFQHGMSAGDSMALYSVLTIGDGLIAQIPALLISLTAGMIITRAAPDGRKGANNMGAEIARQMASEPKSWMIASVGMLAFAALPGMPTVVLEALLAGVPIACSDIEGCRSITDAVGWDVLFPVGNATALGECVARSARSAVPVAVIEAVREGFTWQRKAPELAAFYTGLVSAPRASGE